MIRSTLLLTFALLAALFSCSCATNGEFSNAPPSAKVKAEAHSKPKDRHGMPVYPFQDHQRLVRTTAYTCTEADHLQYGSKTAIGTPLLYGTRTRSAAADWSYYPLGTKFRIKGMPYTYVVEDYGSALTGTGTIDLYKPNFKMMNRWGLRQVEITVLEWGSMRESVEILRDRSRYHHCREMLHNLLRLQPALRSYAQVDERPTGPRVSLASAVLCSSDQVSLIKDVSCAAE